MDVRLYMLLACQRACQAFFGGDLWLQLSSLLDEQDVVYCPCSLRTPMRMGSPLHVMSRSSSLCTVTPFLVKMEMVTLSGVFPTLINDVGKVLKVSACVAFVDSF